MDMARTSINVVGNCLASVLMARWEGVFDVAQHAVPFDAREGSVLRVVATFPLERNVTRLYS